MFVACKWQVAQACVHPRYLAGTYGAAVKAGLPVLPVASDFLLLGAVAVAARTGRAHAVVASRQVHAHAVVPAGVRLRSALVNVWKANGGLW